MTHDVMLINPPRPLKTEEQELLNFLLSEDFRGRELLVLQSRSILVSEECNDCKSIKLLVTKDSPRAEVNHRIPIEAEIPDEDGVVVHVLLHVVNGLLDEIEIYREDLQNLKTILDTKKAILLNPDKFD